MGPLRHAIAIVSSGHTDPFHKKDRILKILGKITSDPFFRQSAIVFVLTQGGAFFHFLFQYLMSHSLSKADYGLLNSLLTFYMVLAIPITTLQMVIAKYVSEYHALGQYENLKQFFSQTMKGLSVGSLGLLICVFIFQNNLATFFHVSDSHVFTTLGFLIIGNIFFYGLTGFFQGTQKFLWVGSIMFLFGFFKWGGAYILLMMHSYSLSHILWIMALTLWIVLLGMFIKTHSFWSFNKNTTTGFLDKVKFFIPSLVSYSLLSLILSMDLILIQHYLGGGDRAVEAGLYATISILGKSVFYLSLSIVTVMFPLASENLALKRSSKALLNKALLFCVAVSGSGFLLFLFFAQAILIFFGKQEAVAAVPYLRLYALAMLSMSVIHILVNYFIAIAKFEFIYIIAGLSILELGTISFFHENIFQVLLGMNGLFLISLILCVSLAYGRKVQSGVTLETINCRG